MKTPSFTTMKKIITCIFPFCFMLSSPAQGVFQASLTMPPDGGAQLEMGDFWFKVENNELDFVAFLSGPTLWTSGLDPVLSVPGSSVGFSLGEIKEGMMGSQIDPNWNPFLPPKPLVPSGYDDDGNPYFALPGPGIIWNGNFYTGHFDLPPGFLDELLAGNGKIEFNSYIVGNINVAAVPEPSVTALVILAIGIGLTLSIWRRKRSLTSFSNSFGLRFGQKR